jgi:hypothetical protein
MLFHYILLGNMWKISRPARGFVVSFGEPPGNMLREDLLANIMYLNQPASLAPPH